MHESEYRAKLRLKLWLLAGVVAGLVATTTYCAIQGDRLDQRLSRLEEVLQIR